MVSASKKIHSSYYDIQNRITTLVSFLLLPIVSSFFSLSLFLSLHFFLFDHHRFAIHQELSSTSYDSKVPSEVQITEQEVNL